MKRRLGLLLAGTLTFWVVVAIPARYLWGNTALLFSAVAAGLCLLPTAATLAWGDRVLGRAPDQQLFLLLGGTGLRMFVVLGVALGLALVQTEFQQPVFWLWLLVFYLFTLGVEMKLLLSGRTAAGKQ